MINVDTIIMNSEDFPDAVVQAGEVRQVQIPFFLSPVIAIGII